MEELNFDEMREQIAILKTKLDNQDIINDRMMHNVVTAKASSIKRIMVTSILCGLVVIVFGPVVFHRLAGASWAFVVATDMMMIYCMTREFLFKRQLSDSNLMNASLLEVAKNMAQFKKAYKRCTVVNMSVLAPVWTIWLVVEVLIAQNSEHAIPFVIGLAIGGVIGLIIGLKMYLNIQNSATDIIKQIEE